MKEIDYDALDPGIRETVRWMRSHGFETTDSGDGVTKLAAGWSRDEVLDVPHVHARVDPFDLVRQADRLVSLVNGEGPGRLGLPFESGQLWSVEASYHPVQSVAVLSLIGVNDDAIAAAKKRWGGP